MAIKTYLYRLSQWLIKGIPVMRVPANIRPNDPNEQLKGKKILLTGGSRGIGYCMAQRFIKEGAEVLIVGRNEKTLKEAAEQLNCKYICYDLNNIKDLNRLVQQAAEQMDGLNALVNNAGICNLDKGFLNVSEQSYDEQFLTNVKSPFFLTQAFLKHVTDNQIDSSSVLFITSERGLYPDDAPYGMTKAAIGNIVAGLARQFATRGVHVNAIAPGVVANTADKPEYYDDLYLKGAVGKRFILPEEIAETATFLLSDASRCISGEIIPCNQSNHLK